MWSTKRRRSAEAAMTVGYLCQPDEGPNNLETGTRAKSAAAALMMAKSPVWQRSAIRKLMQSIQKDWSGGLA